MQFGFSSFLMVNFIAILYLLFKAFNLKLDTRSYQLMRLTIGLMVFLNFVEYEIVNASDDVIQTLSFYHFLIIYFIIFFSVTSIWSSRKEYSKLNISYSEQVLYYIYVATTIFLLSYYTIYYDSIFFVAKKGQFWVYIIETNYWFKYYIGSWLFCSLAGMSLMLSKAYIKSINKSKKYWMKWLFWTLLSSPFMMYLIFFISNDKNSGSHFVYAPFMLLCAYAWTWVYSNFKFYAATPSNSVYNILSIVPSAILIVDDKKNITYINESGKKLLRTYEVKLNSIMTIKHLLLAFDMSLDFLAVFDQLEQEEFKEQIKIQDNVYFEIVVSTIFSEKDEVRGYVVIAHDISQVKEHEIELNSINSLLKKSNIELERFAYIASHDLKTPLRNMISFVGLLDRALKKKDYQSIPDYLEFIKIYGKSMYRLIEDILEYSKANSDDTCLDIVDLNKSIQTVELNLQEFITTKNAVIHCNELPSIISNNSMIIQLFQNLIENGIKYNESEVPTIHISSKIEGDLYIISVKDNGIGIGGKYLKEVFTMFRRLHTINEYEGTGIGLALCKKIVEACGGEIVIQSELGVGTEVLIKYPKDKITTKNNAGVNAKKILDTNNYTTINTIPQKSKAKSSIDQ